MSKRESIWTKIQPWDKHDITVLPPNDLHVCVRCGFAAFEPSINQLCREVPGRRVCQEIAARIAQELLGQVSEKLGSMDLRDGDLVSVELRVNQRLFKVSKTILVR